jgi:DNA-binding transcriptional ArsR family regulator
VRGFKLPVLGTSKQLGWTDLLAVPATKSVGTAWFYEAGDKRARAVRTGLDTLERHGLVLLPERSSTRNRYETFVLLDEAGVAVVGDEREYKVPAKDEQIVTLPPGLISNGWVHLLQDSEIALLLMVASGRVGGWLEAGYTVVPSDVRVRNFGINRALYATARKTLEWLGLLEVIEVNRHDDGKAVDGEQYAHRMQIRVDGFEANAVDAVRRVFSQQLARSA